MVNVETLTLILTLDSRNNLTPLSLEQGSFLYQFIGSRVTSNSVIPPKG